MPNENEPTVATVHQHPASAVAATIFRQYDLQKIPAPPIYLTREIPARTVVTLAGEGGIGKSYLSLDMALSMAIGVGEFGRPDKREARTVFYVDMENGEWLTTVRLHALMRAHSLDPTDKSILGGRLVIIDGQASDFSLDNDSHLVSLFRDMDENGASIVFLDPVMAMMAGDPYSNPAVRYLMDHRIRPLTRNGATAVLPHHVRKRTGNVDLDRGSQDIMGAKAWTDAADEAFKIRGVGPDKVAVEHTKGRTLGKGGPFILGLNLPKRGTPVHLMESRIADLGEPSKNVQKEVAAALHVTHILRAKGLLQAGELDEFVAKAAECSIETAARARRKAEDEGVIRRQGSSREAPYEIADEA